MRIWYGPGSFSCGPRPDPDPTLCESDHLWRERQRIRERSGIKFNLGHALRENNLTKRITSLLSGERKKKEDAYEQIADI